MGNALLPAHDVVEHARAFHAAQPPDGQQRRGLHVAAEHALFRPVFVDLLDVVDVKALVAADDAEAVGEALRADALRQREQQLRVRHGGIALAHIGAGGAVVAHRAGGDEQLTGSDVCLQGSAGADADGVRHADVMQLLDRDAGRDAAHARGHGQNARAAVGADKAAVLAVHAEVLDLTHVRRDALGAHGVAGQDGIADVQALVELDMRLLHIRFSSQDMGFRRGCAVTAPAGSARRFPSLRRPCAGGTSERRATSPRSPRSGRERPHAPARDRASRHPNTGSRDRRPE